MTHEIIHIIHDTRLLDRYEPLMEELKRQGIRQYKIWEPVEDKNSVVRSINKSHKQIVAWAKKAGKKEVIILEDDCCFPAPDGFAYFLKKKPKFYDIYAACNYLPTAVMPGFAAASSLVGFHCYMVHERYFDAYLSLPDDGHIDQLQDGKKYKIMVCHPFAALQRAGWSSNNRAVCDYNTVLNKEDIYHGMAR